MKIVNVLVHWQPDKLIHLPRSFKYITIAKFQEDINWQNEAWSIVVEFDIPPFVQGNPSKGKAYFLVENAPHWRKRISAV